MGQNLIVACTYTTLIQAEVARLALAQAGINAVVNDASVAAGGMFNLFNLTDQFGGAKLIIDQADAEAAWEVLSKDEKLLGINANSCSVASDHNSCLSCGAPMSEEEIECKKCGWTFAIERESDEEENEADADDES